MYFVTKAFILYGYNAKKQRKFIDSLVWSYLINYMFAGGSRLEYFSGHQCEAYDEGESLQHND
jgi:hypothetical protein